MITYEVETRFWFTDQDEIFQYLPFFRHSLHKTEEWKTDFYGLSLYQAGRLLRIAEMSGVTGKHYLLGWKGLDIGKFANIRKELQEEITEGVVSSMVMDQIGRKGFSGSRDELITQINNLGYPKFMSFSGRNISVIYEPLNISVKVMYCDILEYPLILEVEKAVPTLEEAQQAETELYEFVLSHDLTERIVKQEPPDLLYSVTHVSH